MDQWVSSLLVFVFVFVFIFDVDYFREVLRLVLVGPQTEFSSCAPSPSLNTSNVIVASGKHSDSTSQQIRTKLLGQMWKSKTDKIKWKILSGFSLHLILTSIIWAPFRSLLTFTRTVTRCWQRERFMSKVFLSGKTSPPESWMICSRLTFGDISKKVAKTFLKICGTSSYWICSKPNFPYNESLFDTQKTLGPLSYLVAWPHNLKFLRICYKQDNSVDQEFSV